MSDNRRQEAHSKARPKEGNGDHRSAREARGGAGEHAEQLLKAKPPKSGTWLRGQMSVQGLCAQEEGTVKFL